MKDPTSKTQRTFQCRDLLWMRFEQMGQELNCSVDYLINDAMKNYARQRKQAAAGVATVAIAAAPPPPPPPAAITAPATRPPAPAGRVTAPLPPPPQAATRQMPASMPAPPMSPAASNGGPSPVRQPAPQRARRLYVSYGGQHFPVNKEHFVIGRGRQSSDLTIKDPNVSRRHAVVEFQNGNYFLVDMGSTNGVIHLGQRIQRKLIEHGDAVKVCDHDLQFTFQ